MEQKKCSDIVGTFLSLRNTLEDQAKEIFEKLQQEIPRWYRDYFFVGLGNVYKNAVEIRLRLVIEPGTRTTVQLPVDIFGDDTKLQELIERWKSIAT